MRAVLVAKKLTSILFIARDGSSDEEVDRERQPSRAKVIICIFFVLYI